MSDFAARLNLKDLGLSLDNLTHELRVVVINKRLVQVVSGDKCVGFA